MKKTPLVTLARPAWRALVKAATGEPDKEIFGYLVGRWTKGGARVHVALLEGETDSELRSLYLADEDQEAAEKRIVREYAPLEKIGCWHSHPYPEPCRAMLLPQLSDTDELSTALHEIEFITPVFPVPDDTDLCKVLQKCDEFMLQRKCGKYYCRAEAWLRVRKGKIVPCYIKVG